MWLLDRSCPPVNPQKFECEWMPVSGPARGVLCGWRGVVSGVVLGLTCSAGFAQAQDVAEAARQERARKAAQQKPPQHVYTEEDLKRDKILTPDDQARVEARKKQQGAVPSQQDAQTLPENSTPQEESLGEVARRYRQEKAAREAEEARKKNFTPFPYQLPEPSLAAPKIEIAPSSGVAPKVDSQETKTTKAPPVPHIDARANGPHARLSPFQPRPLVPAPPAIRLAPVNPPAMPTPHAAPVRPATPPMTRVAPVDPAAGSVARPVPTAPVTVPNAPRAAGFQPLQVHRGDSWWRLSQRFLGSGARWQELRGMNPEVSGPPELLRAGSVVQVPVGKTIRADAPHSGITMRRGDSLWSIARARYGRGAAWVCLARINPQVTNYTRMAVGTVLVLPSGEAMTGCLADFGGYPRK